MAFDSDIRVGKMSGTTPGDHLEKRVEDRLEERASDPLAGQAVYLKKQVGDALGEHAIYAQVDAKGDVLTRHIVTSLDEYLALVRAFPLTSIQDDAHLKEALAAIDVMLDLPDRSEAQETYLSALTDLVETYETAHVVFPPRTGLDALRFLMESNELRQEDLVPIFGTKSIVSEVLNERRERKLTLEHVKKLAAYFHVSPAVFIDDTRTL